MRNVDAEMPEIDAARPIEQSPVEWCSADAVCCAAVSGWAEELFRVTTV